MKKIYKLNSNYVLGSFITALNMGMIRKLRFIKVAYSRIGLRLLKLFYDVGLLRTYIVKGHFISVYFKYFNGEPICKRIKLISRPGKRCF